MWRDDRTLAALRQVEPLSSEDRLQILGLGLSVSDSLALAFLCAAGRLLARDELLDPALRVQSWTRWREGLCTALTDSLRFSDKDGLVLCVMLAAAIYPLAYPQASLAGFKAMDDASNCAASLRNKGIRPPRTLIRMRAIDNLARVALWRHPEGGDLLRETPGADAASLRAAGYSECIGLRAQHPQAQQAIQLLNEVLPLRWVIDGEGWLLCVREEDRD